MTLRELVSRFTKARKVADGFMVSCPAHRDRNPSLHLSGKDGKLLLHCHAGCSKEAVLTALRIEARDLFLDSGACDRRIVAEYPYTDESGGLLFQVVRYEPKDFRQRRPDGKGGWVWNLQGVRRVLYRLPEVIEAESVLVCEGEKDCETARTLGLVATCNPHGVGKWRTEYSECLRDKRICIIADADEPGRKHAAYVAGSLLDKVEILKVLELPGAKDLTEWKERAGTRPALVDLINAAPKWKPASGAEILDSLMGFTRPFVSLTEPQARVVVLWMAHTHAIEAAEFTPYLNINSAEKESGKTRLLEVLKVLVANPWGTENASAPAMVRKIHKGFESGEPVTVLFDERDSQAGADKERAEAIRGILNSGYERGGCYSRCVGEGSKMAVVDFSTFAAKALAGIGGLTDTVASRSIPIRMKRAPRGQVAKFRRRGKEGRKILGEGAELKARLGAWCAANLKALADAQPDVPDALSDRQADVCEPLLAIADAAGVDWPEAARAALVKLCAEAQRTDDSVGVKLLRDIGAVFAEKKVDELASVVLADELAKIETSPWGEWSKGNPLSAAKLARLLKPFEIRPERIGDRDSRVRGYVLSRFQEAFSLYLPPESVHPSTNRENSGDHGDSKPSTKDSVDTLKNAVSPAKNADGGHVDTFKPGTEAAATSENPEWGEV